MSNQDERRAVFEIAFVKKTASLKKSRPDGYEEVLLKGMEFNRVGDTYENPVASAAWWAWNASRKAVVVEIPGFDDYPTSMARDMQGSLRSIIEAQGLKVKP